MYSCLCLCVDIVNPDNDEHQDVKARLFVEFGGSNDHWKTFHWNMYTEFGLCFITQLTYNFVRQTINGLGAQSHNQRYFQITIFEIMKSLQYQICSFLSLDITEAWWRILTWIIIGPWNLFRVFILRQVNQYWLLVNWTHWTKTVKFIKQNAIFKSKPFYSCLNVLALWWWNRNG